MITCTRYCRPSDIVNSVAGDPTHNGTLSTDATYGLANLSDGNPAKPTKWTTTTALRLVWNFGSPPQTLAAAFLPNHNLDPGGVIRLQANSADAWGAPPLDLPLTVPALDLDGHCRPLWWSLVDVAAPTYAYWSLSFPANSVPFQIGEVALVATLRSWTRGFFMNLRRSVRRRFIPALETAMGSKNYYDLNTKTHAWLGHILASDQDLVDLETLLDDAHGPVYPWYLVPDINAATTDGIAHTDGGYLVRFSDATVQAFNADWLGAEKNPVAVEFEEVPAGLPL